jgi:DNA-binding MarR family transcriptional regulator/GNAT superfamily N-acetyltransferase
MDTINELADLAFASRLKRLSERLMKDVSLLYYKLDTEFEARWFTILYTLNHKSPMPVTALAESLNITHTAVNQLSSEMIKKGLVNSSSGKQDERQRLLSISLKGRNVALSLTPVWEEIRSATEELINSADPNLLSAIGKIEKQLDKQNMYERVWIRLRGIPPGEITILDYRPAYKKYFESLNREWLQEYFEIENEDQKILSDPNGKIIKKGGAIFFAALDESIVGTAALIHHRNGIYELLKMTVTKNAQGLGIGKKLTHKVIEHAKSLGANEIYLQTSPKLKAANNLYKKLGFRKTKKSPFADDRFIRPTFTMKLTV